MATSAEQLRDTAVRFVRRFGLVAALWSTILAATAPAVDHPARMWAVLALLWAWALGSQAVGPPRAWYAGWLLAASVVELLGPLAGTHGWSLGGGASFIPLSGAALSGRRVPVVGTVAWLSLVALARSVVGTGWAVAGSLGTVLIFVFGGLALAWLVRVLLGGLEERDRLQAALLEAETAAAREAARAEASARLHDTVLQHLAAVQQADALDAARQAAGRASNELRAFLRAPRASDATVRGLVERVARDAADGAALSVGGVGDRPAAAPDALLADATAEAVRNAVRHAVGPVRVFVEVSADATTVTVTDRGPGFSLADVPPDRLGVRESIVARLERAGGQARLASSPGGSEWELTLPA